MEKQMPEKVLIIAYGNRDREDDGAGWHILNKLAAYLEIPAPLLPGDRSTSPSGRIELLYLFQLLPEMAEDLPAYDQVIFIDAHNTDQLPELSFEPIGPSTRRSAFTHHMSAEELLEISRTLGGKLPMAYMLSIRGYSFQFREELSGATSQLVEQAFYKLTEHLGLFLKPQPYQETDLLVYKRSSGFTAQSRPIISEHQALLRVNGQDWLTFICSPAELEDLARGFLWNADVINSLDSIGKIEVSADLQLIDVRLNLPVHKPENFHRTSTGLEPGLQTLAEPLEDTFRVTPGQMAQLLTLFDELQGMHDLAGGFHAAALSDGNTILMSVEDLGRHNCVDKLAGKYLAAGKPFTPYIMLLSGRISSEMVLKSRAMGVEMLISRTTPTDLAVRMADEAGITLVGYMRQNGFEVLSHPDRIVQDA